MDDVLKLAFAVGDPFPDLLHDDHTPFQPALGSNGPPPPVQRPWQIPNATDFGHGDYLPSLTPSAQTKWPKAAGFIKRAFLNEKQTWPPA